MSWWRVLLFALIFFFGTDARSQNVTFGLQVGGSFYNGDLSLPDYTKNVQQAGLAFGGIVRLTVWNGVDLRVGALRTEVNSSDANSGVNWRESRDLSFQSEIFEIYGAIELHPLQWFEGFDESNFSPYVFGGLGYMWFDPKTEYNGSLIALQPVGTEGQGMPGFDAPYELSGLDLPFGLGLRYSWKSLVFDLEYGARRTSTDYLDDVSGNYVSKEDLLAGNGQIAADLGNKINASTGSQRGNNGVNDYYTAVVLTVGYRLGMNGSGYIYNGKKGKALDCPKF